MTLAESNTSVLVLAPMPTSPTSAGNRRRLLATCDALKRNGFSVDLAYLEHEDQIYHRFGQHPPTDVDAMSRLFARVFLIPLAAPVPLKTWAEGGFSIDAWCPDEAIDFVKWYFKVHRNTRAIIVNYVFLSRCLEAAPANVLRVIDTHDRFADRQLQYRPFRSEPNFFYTDQASEAIGLSRADAVLAIQAVEAAYFRELVDREVYLFPPRFFERRPFHVPKQLETLGFIGHGNDPNLFSISKFAHAWAAAWQSGLPVLLIAGEICGSLGDVNLPGVVLVGYVEDIETFYDGIDAVIAPMLMGSGLKMKVAEALSMGRPVIGTRIAFEGFETEHAAHCLRGVSDTVATVLRLQRDAGALADLTAACADLFKRYNEASASCEKEWIATIPRQPIKAELASTDTVCEAPRRLNLGSVLLTQEYSRRSLPVTNEEGGILVATESLSPVAAQAAGYAAYRRRWFARVEEITDVEHVVSRSLPDLRGVAVTLAPEWIHGRTLPRQAREMLALCFASAQPDWAAEASVIGQGPDGSVVTSNIPSFLLSGRQPSAAFFIGADKVVRELRLSEIIALARTRDMAFMSERSDLTPVPAVLKLVPIDLNDPSSAHRLLASPLLSRPEMLLLLFDNLIGHLRLESQIFKFPDVV